MQGGPLGAPQKAGGGIDEEEGDSRLFILFFIFNCFFMFLFCFVSC